MDAGEWGTVVEPRAIFPALKAIGLSDGAIRRAWRAFRRGKWQIATLLCWWRDYVQGLPGWTAHRYEGYRPVTVDVTAFWHPALKTCPSKHYHPAAQRALPAVIVGLVGEVGEIQGQRLALPRRIERVHPKDPSEKRLWHDLLAQFQKELGDDEIAAVDAGMKIKALQAANVDRYVVRLAVNFTARQRKGKTLAATPPDEWSSWVEQGRELRVEIWRNVVLNTVKPDPTNRTFDVYAFYDPAFKHPWLLATPVVLQPPSVYGIYTDRWPVEQLPLSAKQMVGAHRQFVHHPASVQRLPELALLAGSILSFLAATGPVSPTGFWDRCPQRTPGRLRRTLFGHPFPKVVPFPGQLREKHSATAHLPKGAAAHPPRAA